MIAVLIPYYNEPDGLIKSLNSISYRSELNVVIVDDGSKVKFDDAGIRKMFPFKFHFINNEINQGIEGALNDGIQYIQKKLENCKYIARLDCGDECVNDRLEKQMNFMERNPEIHLLGCWVERINLKGKFLYISKLPSEHKDILKGMHVNNMIYNGPAMLRYKPILKEVGFYPLGYKAAEDHAYFFAIAKKFEVANLPETLYRYVIDPNSISSRKRKQQVISRIKILIHNMDISYYSIYGLLRNILVLLFPRMIMENIKKWLNK